MQLLNGFKENKGQSPQTVVEGGFKVDQQMLNDENLVLVKPKKSEKEGGVQPGYGKRQK